MTSNADVSRWHCFKTELLTHIPVVSFSGVPDLRTLILKLILGNPLTHNPETIVRQTFIIHMVAFPLLCGRSPHPQPHWQSCIPSLERTHCPPHYLIYSTRGIKSLPLKSNTAAVKGLDDWVNWHRLSQE